MTALAFALRRARLNPRQQRWFVEAETRLADAVEELCGLGVAPDELTARVRSIVHAYAADTEGATDERAT